MNFNNCHNINSFRQLAKQKLPSPIFNYIDGAADDEVTYSRNTKSFEDADLVPNVLRGVEDVDLTTKVFGKNISMPIYCALIIKEKELLQRLPVNLEPCLEFLL